MRVHYTGFMARNTTPQAANKAIRKPKPGKPKPVAAAPAAAGATAAAGPTAAAPAEKKAE